MKLYVFGNLICNDRSNGKDLVFQIVAQQEVPDGAHGYHGKTVTEFPSDLTQYYHKQDVEDAKKFLAGEKISTVQRPIRNF